MGIMAALLERGVSGKGQVPENLFSYANTFSIVVIDFASTADRSINLQVVDSCMVEGAAYVGSWLFASRDMFVWGQPRY